MVSLSLSLSDPWHLSLPLLLLGVFYLPKYIPERQAALESERAGDRELSATTNYKRNYSDYSDIKSNPRTPPSGTLKGLFCRLETVHSRCCAIRAQWSQFEHHADICQPLSPNKRKGAARVLFNHVVILFES